MKAVLTIVPGRLRVQYSLRALLALTASLSVPLAFWASRERAFRALVAAATPLLDRDGERIFVEKPGRGPELSRDISSVHDLERDDVIVGATCDTSKTEEVAAILSLSTLKDLHLYDPGPNTFPGSFETLRKMGFNGTSDRIIEVGPYLLFGDDPPLGAIDPLLREIVSKSPSLEKLDLVATSVSAVGLRHLTALRSLRSLDLSRTRIVDDDLRYIPAMCALEELILELTGPNRTINTINAARRDDLRATSYGREITSGKEITDEGLRRLAGASRLRILRLRGAKVSGVGFKDLASLAQLEEVNLRRTDFNDEGARHLALLPSIQRLDLSATKITSAASAYISTMPRLSTLSLSGAEIGDRSLRRLVRLPRLSKLNLRETRITDAGLVHLAAMPSLETVDLTGASSITPAGIARLQGLRRRLKIIAWGQKTRTAAKPVGVGSKKSDGGEAAEKSGVSGGEGT